MALVTAVVASPAALPRAVLVHGVLVVQIRALGASELLALLAVEDVGLGHRVVAAAGQHALHAVLDVLDGDLAVLDLRQEIRRDAQRQKAQDAVVVLGVGRVESLLDGVRDLLQIKFDDLAVPLYYLIHISYPHISLT